MNVEKCTLVITTYNWPEALNLLLQSILLQTKIPNEVIVADDGSTEETADLIKKYQSIFPIPLIHVWHQDKGFYKTMILNKAIAKASNEYIIQIDGDILLEPHYIQDHLKFARKNYFVRGSRSMLNETATQQILMSKKMPDVKFLKTHCSNKMNSKRNLLIAKIMRDRYKTKGKNSYNILGCNMAFWKSDFIKVNGYNENIIGWGVEDIELAIRLLKAGVKKQSLKMAAIAFHLHHKLNAKDNKNIHKKILNQTLENHDFRAMSGINQYM